jgi:hypothetical protein
MTYIDPGALNAIVKALNQVMPDPIVDHRYVADVIAVTLRGGGYGIESYPAIIAKRQAALSEDGHRNHRLSNAMNVIRAAHHDYVTGTDRPYPVEDEIVMYLASAGYRIVPDTSVRTTAPLHAAEVDTPKDHE